MAPTLVVEVEALPVVRSVAPGCEDSGDVAWVLICTVLVLGMMPALAFFEAGLLRYVLMIMERETGKTREQPKERRFLFQSEVFFCASCGHGCVAITRLSPSIRKPERGWI